ncbi:MAG TPA: HAMP domain-containing sensor histidine kinase [Verrucomicrobiae bacterium]|nr:HAMP domain-containing sensor histidine kinase [Verrucomicrobiae bacterium]
MPVRKPRMPWLVLAAIVLILGSAVFFTTLLLRRVIRRQIIQQDGIGLYAATFVQDSLLEGLGPEITSDPELRFADMATQMFETASRRGAMAVRLFDASGQLQMAMPLPAAPRQLDAVESAAVRDLRPVSSFDAQADLSEFGQETGSGPVVRALVPLQADDLVVGSAEFVLHGDRVAAALAALDRDLLRYASMIFLMAGGMVSVSLAWAFGRLNKSNQLLAERTQRLLRANHELTLSAKTSAIGAITAHLIHDLKNPLFGLQSFVTAGGSSDAEDWELAANSAEQMQKMIAEIVRILQEEKTTEQYELSLTDLFDVLHSKLKSKVDERGLEFVMEGSLAGQMCNRDANIILLIMTNLLQNALQATPAGGQIAVRVESQNGQALFFISDTGPGLPAPLQNTLFTPARSTKAGGSGLGLAISKQLANHLGAELTLKQSSKEGTTFQLSVPERVFAGDLACP